ncbi:MAG: DUF4956 domain-containing protein [Erysipelotrichaceae bacterium]|nr:DUF4956 domain-containing protein [Erysipelotrichaceae bacterium]MDY3830704.1 DUF4956 domain-containing protein [Erysipelotrichaceae bacterium]MDY5728247.1 DUF4956 domain-containing protein [Erysipelotrichaceae bacterium]
MNIIDAIKNSVLEQFNGSISVEMILISLLVSFVISLFIVFVYKKTFSGVVYNKTIVMTIVMIAMVTSMVIRTINSNLSLSLGMVGALSIIRFRTAIKEPMDTAFLFWAIVSGIMCGAGLYFIAVCGSLLLGLLFYVLYLMDIKAKSQYLLVVIYKSENSQIVESKLDSLTKKKLKSKSVSGNNVIEVTYEVEYDNTVDELMKSLSGDVRNVNLVTYTNDYGL